MTTTVLVVIVGLFVWSFAEAYVWPVVPDAPLAVAVFIGPDVAMVAVVATVVGSCAGGATAMAARRRGTRWPLPLVSARMRAKVAEWLDRGAVGLIHQPLSAVPYKAFVVEAAARGIGTGVFTVATACFRGMRITATAGMAVLAHHLAGRWAPAGSETEIVLVVLVVSSVLFLVGWRSTHRLWADPVPGGAARMGGMPTPDPHTMRS
jgi:membrane protein YqaA with SNARE-associated domain